MARSKPVPEELMAAAAQEDKVEVMPLLERLHVQSVYDSVAHEWHGTRYKAWPRVVEFVNTLPRHSLVADVGCGNGKLAPAFRSNGHFGIGSDFSTELVRISAVDMQMEAQVADALMLPYRSDAFDAVTCIAVLHHITTQVRRQRLIAEALRVLRPGGQALFYAWAMDQTQGGRSGHLFESQDVFVPFHKRQTHAGDGPHSAQNHGDAAATAATSTNSIASAEHGCYDPAKKAHVFQRYCHVYRQGELTDLAASVDGTRILEEYYDAGNWCILAQKVE
uniref:Methyltransferase type 11 domain-containing protein n=3 Tax=Chrysotila carterae TaxID=13221 RepID=A0A7S4ESV5_CHRCT|mmetsp:Transcript_30706/g.67251  ORF Transcript_30706/g.67251 Transcript_30706/m.67251 type:complete len:278 (-) Transcript_30706:354-1187(-)